MKTIHKKILKVADSGTIRIPYGWKFLHIAGQRGEVCMWVEVDTREPEVEVRYSVRGTGKVLDGSEGKHIGTALVGSFVWHVYSQDRVER